MESLRGGVGEGEGMSKGGWVGDGDGWVGGRGFRPMVVFGLPRAAKF